MNREELTRRVREKLETMSLEELGSLAGLEALDMSGMNPQQRVACLLEGMELDMLAGMLSIPLEPAPPAAEPPPGSTAFQETDTGDAALHGHMLRNLLPKGSGEMLTGTGHTKPPVVGILSDPEPTRPRVRVDLGRVMDETRQRDAAEEKENEMLRQHTNTPLDPDDQSWLSRPTRRGMQVAGGICLALVMLNLWAGRANSKRITAEEQRATLEMQTKAMEAIATRIADKLVGEIRKDVARLQDDMATARKMIDKNIINLSSLTLLTKGHQDVLVQHTKQLQTMQLQKVMDELERLKRKLDTVDALDRATQPPAEVKPVTAEPPPPAPERIYDGEESAPKVAKAKRKTPMQESIDAARRRLGLEEGDEAPKPVSKEIKEKVRQETITPSESDFR